MRYHYAWVIVAVSFANLALSTGTNQSFAIWFPAILQELGESRAATAGIFSAGMLVLGFTGPVVGGLLQRWGPRRVLSLGMLLLGAGLALAAASRSVTHLYLTLGLLAPLGMSATSWVAHGSAIAPWFARGQGLAVGLAYAGMGAGPLAVALFAQAMIGSYGWRWAMASVAAVVAAVGVPVNLRLMRDRPSELGLRPWDGEPRGGLRGELRAETPRNGPQGGMQHEPSQDGLGDELKNGPPLDGPRAAGPTLAEALRSESLWLMFFAFFFVGLGMFVVVPHMAAFFLDAGYPPGWAAAVVGGVGLFSSAGRLGFGWVSDWRSPAHSSTASTALSVAGIAVLLALERLPAPLGAALFTLSFGLGFGARGPVLLSLAAQRFAGSAFSVIWGTIALGNGLGAAIGPLLSGAFFDLTGSYRAALWIAIASSVVGSLAIALVQRRISKAHRPWEAAGLAATVDRGRSG